MLVPSLLSGRRCECEEVLQCGISCLEGPMAGADMVCVCGGGVFTYERVQKSLVFLNFSTLLCFETRFLTEGLDPGLARLAGR